MSSIALDALGEPLPTQCPGFESGRDHMPSNGEFELDEKLNTLSLHPSPSPAHGVSDVDEEKFVNDDERVCQVQSDQIDALASTPKAAAPPSWTTSPTPVGDQKHSEQADPRSDCRASTRSPRPSLEHACPRATTIHPPIPGYHISPFHPTAISPNQ